MDKAKQSIRPFPTLNLTANSLEQFAIRGLHHGANCPRLRIQSRRDRPIINLRGEREVRVEAIKCLQTLAKLIGLQKQRLVLQLAEKPLQPVSQLLGAPSVRQQDGRYCGASVPGRFTG